MKMKKNFISILLGITILFTGCSLFEEPDRGGAVMGYNVEFAYFLARGFNLRFIGVIGTVENIMTDEITYDFNDGITLNVDNTMIVDYNDVITIADNKRAEKGNYNVVFVNCERNAMRFDCNEQTLINNSVKEYSGTLYFVTDESSHVFEFSMHDGVFIASAPAQYLQEGSNASLPLSGSEVQAIIDNGREGIDYTLFTRDGVTYVKIGNNLYMKRYESWNYSGIADPFVSLSWMRHQKSLIFEVVDWDILTAPYEVYNKNGKRTEEDRENVYPGAYYYTAGGIKIGGNRSDLNDITTPLMGCEK
jgi:hypothetical protein